MIPGEIIVSDNEIEINKGSTSKNIIVENMGDRPIQVGSHYHFYEVNAFLKFDRNKTLGMRLNIASGTAIRFEPGQSREVQLVDYLGKKNIYGFNALVNGSLKKAKNHDK